MEFNVIRSKRRTISIKINIDLSITVRVPLHISRAEIERILKKKEYWINKRMTEIKENLAKYEDSNSSKLTPDEHKLLINQARRIIPEKVATFAKLIGVEYGRITIRTQKTRWGSCSSSGNLNFNCLLMLAPSNVLDYVVVHELCHRKEMNHSKAFWREVEKIIPNYEEPIRWLRKEGSQIIYMQRS